MLPSGKWQSNVHTEQCWSLKEAGICLCIPSKFGEWLGSHMDRGQNTVFIFCSFIHFFDKYVLMPALSQGSDFVYMTVKKTDKHVFSHGAW